MLKRVSIIALFSLFLMLPASAQTFNKTFLSSYDAATDKVVQLAGAFSQDQYAWRPNEGVRSVSEAIMHVASANFFFASMLGAETPAGINPQELEATVKTKAKAVEILEMSIKHAREAVNKQSEAALAEEIDLFGGKAPRMRLVLLIGDHANEHLGQLIAYARSNGVTPPWSN